MTEREAVLIVEDEALILMDIAFQLQAEGYTVYEAMNANAAIQLLMAHPEIRLIFTDIDMPGSMDGLTLAAAVRDRWPPVKIIITSGARAVEVPELPSGSVFFSKPYDHAAVFGCMRELLSA